MPDKIPFPVFLVQTIIWAIAVIVLCLVVFSALKFYVYGLIASWRQEKQLFWFHIGSIAAFVALGTAQFFSRSTPAFSTVITLSISAVIVIVSGMIIFTKGEPQE